MGTLFDPAAAERDLAVIENGALARGNGALGVELGEIEARLAEHAGVGEAVVVVREDDAGGKRLVGDGGKKAGAEVLNIKELRSHPKERLPEYTVPSAWVELERLPLSSNGKIDRKSLPKPEATVCE